MSSSPNPPPRTGGLSLYANLLDPSSTTSSTSIQRAPIVFNKQTSGDATASAQDDSASSAQKMLNAAALRFQPTKRPQVNQPKKPKIAMKPVGASAGATTVAATTTTTTTTTTVVEPARPVVKTTLNDWAHTGNSDDDVNGFYAQKERERNQRRKKRKKNKEAEYEPVHWDDIYDPARPNNYEEYRDGDEKIREMKEWRERLYGPRREREYTRSDDESDDGYRPSMDSRFAPPKFNFAPPPPPSAPVEIPDDATGEDAYARRVRLSQMAASGTPPPPPEDSDRRSTTPVPPPPPLPPADTTPTATISRAPVLYQQPIQSNPSPPPADREEENDSSSAYPEDETRSLRPGQQGFAHRLLAKYGWTKGSGLGAEGTGIVKPLQVVTSKKKDEAGRGKIIDQNKRKGNDAEGKFGKMTEVVVLRGMLKGIHIEEITSGELRQEIGEECGEKYGRVERVYFHLDGVQEEEQDGEGPKVFVQFTSQLSALRAVNALEGRLFNGNTIEARFYDKDKFEKGIYD